MVAGWACIVIESHVAAGASQAYRVEVAPHQDPGRLIEDFAKDHDALVYAEVSEFGTRTIYTADSGAGAGWLRKGYHGLIPSNDREVKPLDELPDGDFRQIYFLSGGQQVKDDFVSVIRSNGGSGTNINRALIAFLSQSVGLATTYFLGFAVALVGIFFAAVANNKRYAVQRLHGFTRRQQFSDDFRRIYLPHLGWYAIALAAPPLVFAFLSTPAMAIQFSIFFGVLCAIIVSGCACGHFIAISVLRIGRILPAIRGKLMTIPTLFSATVLRIFLVSVTLSFCSSAFGVGAEFREQSHEAIVWDNKPQVIVSKVTGARQIEDYTESREQVAKAVKAAAIRSEVYYFDYLDEGITKSVGVSTPAMAINKAAANSTLPPELSEELDRLPPDQTHVFAHVHSGVTPEKLVRLNRECASRDCVLHTVEEDYEAFTWQTGIGAWIPPALAKNVTVTIFPNDQLPADSHTIFSALTHQSIGFTSKDSLERFISETGMPTLFVGHSDKRSDWDTSHRAAEVDTKIAVFGAALSIVALAVVGSYLGFLLHYCYRQRATVLYLLGRSGLEIYLKVLPWEIMVLCATFGILWVRNSQLREFTSGNAVAPSPEMIAIATTSPYAVMVTIGAALLGAALSVIVFARLLERAIK